MYETKPPVFQLQRCLETADPDRDRVLELDRARVPPRRLRLAGAEEADRLITDLPGDPARGRGQGRQDSTGTEERTLLGETETIPGLRE